MAGKDNNIGIKISTDIADLKSGIKSIKDEISRADKDFQKATAGLDKWSTSSEGLEAKLTQLNTKLDSQKKSVKLYQDEIERVSKLEGDHSVQLQQLKDKLESAEIAVKKTEKEIKHYSNSLEDVVKNEKEAETELGKLTKTISEQESELKDLQTEYKDAVITFGKNSKEAKALKGDIEKLSNELDDNRSAVKEADDELEKLDKQFDETADSAEQFSKGIDGIKNLGGTVAKGIGAIGAGVGALAGAFLATASETKEFRTNMGKLEAGFETSGLKAEQASETYKQLFSVVADEGKATEATAMLGQLATSQEDLNKWVSISTGVYATFGDSLPIENLAEASLETSKTGKITGGLADALNWAGISEEKFQESLDKCTTEQERQKLITDTLNKTYDEASKKYQQVNKDVIDSNKAQVNLTDTMAKLGERAEPILTVVKDGFNQLLQEVLKLTENVDFEELAEKIKEGFAYFIDTIIPAIKDGFQWILDNKDVLIAGIVAIGTGMLAWNVVSIVQGVVGAIKAWTVATEGMTVAQKLLNLAMKANPIGIIITVITALVTAFVLLWNKSDAFREFWIGLWDKLKSVVGTVVDWIKKNWDTMLLFLMNPVAGVFKYLYENFDGFRNKVDSVVKKVVQFFKDCWSNIKSAWSGAKAYFNDLGEKIANAFKNIPTKIKEFFSNAWAKAKEAWSTVTTFFSDTKDKVIDAFVSLPADMLDVGKNLVEGLWNGVKDKTDWVIKKLKSFGDDVLGGIKKFFGIASPSKKMAEVGKFLDEGLAQGIEKNKRKVTKATDKLGQDVLNSISGIEKELEKKNIANKIVALGGKVENPFATWTWSQLDSEAKKLEEHLDSINQKIIKNGVTQEEWGTSQDKINERAKLLEERLIAQNKLIEVINARLPKTVNQDVKSNYETKLNDTQKAIEVTMSEFGELEDKVTSIPEKMSFTDKLFNNIGESFGYSGDKLTEFVGSAKDKMKELGNALKDIFSQGFDAWNESINKQIEALDKELEKFNAVKDAEIEKNKSYQDEQLAILESALASGTITEKTYQLKKQQLEKDTANKTKQLEEEKRKQEELTLKKKNELAKKQFNAQKANDIATTLINGASAIVTGFKQLGPIGGAINAGVQAGITATQVGIIAKQKFVPMLAKGGIVDNPTLAMVGEAGKEAVIPLENNTGWIRELAEKLNEVMRKDFSFGINTNSLQPALAGASTVNNYYYQTINSPQQLSRKEIYRDTKNLLSLRG